MTSHLFDLPIELRSLIFLSFSLRDISRLRQCCSAWKNNLQDLSFMKVLDFSYSPDITSEYFDELLEKRINRAQNSITKVIIAHIPNLHEDSLHKLFSVLPRLKDIRIRHAFFDVSSAKILSILFQQQDLECIVYIKRKNTVNPFLAKPVDIQCTKLKRCKIRLNTKYVTLNSKVELNNDDPNTIMLKLLELNPALKHDPDFLIGFVSKAVEIGENGSPLLDIALSLNDLRVHKRLWKQIASRYYRPSSVAHQLLNRTIQLLHGLPKELIQSNATASALCSAILRASKSGFLKDIQENVDWLKSLVPEDKPQIGDYVVNNQEQQLKWLERLKKRLFYRDAYDEYLRLCIERLKSLSKMFVSWPGLEPLLKDKFVEELNDAVTRFSSFERKLPRVLCLLQAPILLRQGKAKEAFDKYLAAIEPKFVFELRDYYNNTNMQALFGAYHVARDYLKSPDGLERLSPENIKLLIEHFEPIQPCFDQGVCTRSTGSTKFYKQYMYVCYTCGFNGATKAFDGLC